MYGNIRTKNKKTEHEERKGQTREGVEDPWCKRDDYDSNTVEVGHRGAWTPIKKEFVIIAQRNFRLQHEIETFPGLRSWSARPARGSIEFRFQVCVCWWYRVLRWLVIRVHDVQPSHTFHQSLVFGMFEHLLKGG